MLFGRDGDAQMASWSGRAMASRGPRRFRWTWFSSLFCLWAAIAIRVDVKAETGQGIITGSGDERRCVDHLGRALRCIPEFVNAAFNVRVEATNTCGLDRPAEFCVQTGVTAAHKYCDVCSADWPNTSHGPQFLTDFNNDGNLTWWQSETLLAARDRIRDQLPSGAQIPLKVNLTLRLGKAFDITYVRLKFHSPRPESFSIYKRTSENSSWTPYQFYSGTCRDTYGLPDSPHILGDDETQALCTSEYSDISPLTGGNVAFSTLEGRPSANNFENSEQLQEWVTATDIRISLDRLNMFGDEVFGDPKVLKSYFYAVSDLAVGGRCKCHGHANKCIHGHDGRLACQCEHFTDGRDCEKCLPFYNDKPWKPANGTHANPCEPCNCSGRSNRCDFNATLYEQTQGRTGGYCKDCADNFDGPHCEVCRENYYLRSDGICVTCDCDVTGSHSLQCNGYGRCQCKPGVTGEKCDRCEANYYDFSFQGCRPCGCNLEGSLGNNPNCDPTHGLCECKEFVEGQRCDTCKPGFFNLDGENDFGCTPCFCYGHSSVCHSAPGYFKSSIESHFSRDAEQWTARDQHGASVSMQYNALAQNIAVSAPRHGTVYFVASKQFLGDQRHSYNQILSFDFRVNREGSRASIEDILLEGVGLQIRLPIFGQGNQLPTDENQEYKFLLHEHPNYGWNPTLTARDFISILSNLTAIRIRATYMPEGVGFLDNVRLESAQRGGFGVEAKWVERCTCAEGYLGQFCESCAPGYRHDPPGNDPFARCIPCNCHGHAEICDDATGRCMCRDNTAGDHCERCARGFYGSALDGTSEDCKACPCPNQGSCFDLGYGEVLCQECPQGYGGHRCDVCVEGYFGDPSGRLGVHSPCVKCECNGNVDPNAVGNCNKTTGECLKCIYNTGGYNCERCLPGFHGDALALTKGDCKPCNCNPYGSQRQALGSMHCNILTGQCDCLQHVRGLQCDQCFDGYWNLESGDGCQLCNCDLVGAKNQSCDLNSGQCICQEGVTGQQCDKCLSYHYSFSYTGCKACDCDPIGSSALQCEADSGQCPCRENFEGRRCERCKENKYDKHLGCVDCPACYNLVQDAVTNHRAKLFELQELLDNIDKNPDVVLDLNFELKLKEINRTVDELLRIAESSAGIDVNLKQQLDELHKRLKPLQKSVEEITNKVETAEFSAKEGERNVSVAENILKEIKELLKNAQKLIREDGEIAYKNAKEKADEFGTQSDRMSKIASEARIKTEKQEEDAAEIDSLAKQAKNTSVEAYRIAQEAANQQRQAGDEVYKLKRDLKNTEDLMKRTKKLAKDALDEAKTAYDEALKAYTEAQILILPEYDMDSMKENAADIIDEARTIQNEVDNLMNKYRNQLGDLKQQMEDAEKLLEQGRVQQQTSDRLLSEVDAALVMANDSVAMGDKTLAKAKEILHTLLEFDELVKQSETKANEALKTIPGIEALIKEAEVKTAKAKSALTGAQGDATDALDIAKEAQRIAEKASQDAESINQDAMETRMKANEMRDEADDLEKSVANKESELQNLDETAKAESGLAAEALNKANTAKTSAEQASRKVKDSLSDVNEILRILATAENIDTYQLDELERKLTRAKDEMKRVNLDQRMGELRAAKTLQNTWIYDYSEELKRLTRDVNNVREIREALPQKCYTRVKLEPKEKD